MLKIIAASRGPLQRAYNATGGTAPPTSSSYPAFPAVNWTPASQVTGAPDGWFRIDPDGQTIEVLKIIPFGVGADGTTMKLRVLGFDVTKSTLLYPPVILCDYPTITLGTRAGSGSSGDFRSTESLADTCADPTIGNKNLDTAYVTAAGENSGIYIVVGGRGFRLFRVDVAVGTATNANALVGIGS